ncbi:hypothetical protein N9W46_04990 [Litoricolaceae bacterium]|nr:hypothetical protein [Litorivicinaceae bacterium]
MKLRWRTNIDDAVIAIWLTQKFGDFGNLNLALYVDLVRSDLNNPAPMQVWLSW